MTRGGTPTPTLKRERLLITAEQYGYWDASPEENARFGLHLIPAGPHG
jgi:hypothetical protein